MARSRRAVTNRTLARILRAGEKRAGQIAQFIVDDIATNPNTPEDTSKLRYSYYATQANDGTGDWLIKNRTRYWVYVEFGTHRPEAHGAPAFSDAQPHVGPAIEAARMAFE